MALKARLLAKVRRDRRHLHRLGPDEAVARGVVAIHIAETGTQIPLAKMGVRSGSLLGGVGGGNQLVSRNIVLEEEGWSQVKASTTGGLQRSEGRGSARPCRPRSRCEGPSEG